MQTEIASNFAIKSRPKISYDSAYDTLTVYEPEVFGRNEVGSICLVGLSEGAVICALTDFLKNMFTWKNLDKKVEDIYKDIKYLRTNKQ